MVDIVFTLVPVLLLLILFFQGSLSSIYTDFSCKWHLYAFSAPLNAQMIALVKFGELLCLWLVAFLLELGTGYIYGTIFGFANAKTGMIAYCFFSSMYSSLWFLRDSYVLSISHPERSIDSFDNRICPSCLSDIWSYCAEFF
jgi:hypothetical protein